MPNQTVQDVRDTVARATGVVKSATALINGFTARMQAAVEAALANGATAEELAPVQSAIDEFDAAVGELASAVETVEPDQTEDDNGVPATLRVTQSPDAKS